ncbi:alpha/beta fold hydrolase [Niveibacterium sp. SC-1]|uniref:alpha/beta hydrolase n=1 Tax=Niveibacterium sp. SC-1 TaxID=3135646 RepID=UPI00311E80FF
MNARAPHSLEILSALPESPRATPLLFVHGAHAGAWCWQEHFLSYFAEAGYAAYAVSLSGHGGSPGRTYLDALSIDDYVRDLREAAAALPTPPVVIGHSMGGFVLQKYLEAATLPGAVLLCSVPPLGMMAPAVGLALRRPGLIMDLGKLAGGGQIGTESLVDAMFYRALPEADLRRFFEQMQPESQRAIWDMMGFSLPRVRRDHCPQVLVMGAEEDALIPAVAVRHTAFAWGVTPRLVPGIGHGVMLETNWQAAAAPLRDWLLENFA